MTPVEWFVDGLAETVVARREDRMLCEISRRAWAVMALMATWSLTLLVLVCEVVM